jgi:hypothetical protein
VVAEQLLLGDSAVDVKQKRVLVEGYLWRNTQDYILLDEGFTVDFVVGQSPFDSAAYHVLEFLQISR